MTIEVDAGGTVVEFPDGTPHDVMENALRAHFSPPKSPPADRTQSLATDFLNQGPAAGQGTTPNIAAHMPQLLSTDLQENDAGEILYRDPSTGKYLPTDQNKHVVLRDPSDNRLKVFARTEGTNESTASAAGRIAMLGMASAAPTRLPGGAGMAMMARARGPAPTIDALKEAASAGYQSPEVAALEVKAPAISSWAERTRAGLNEVGLDENLAPKTFGILSKLDKAPDGAFVTGKNLESLRRMLGNAAGSADAVERKAAKAAVDALHDFSANLPAAETIAGDAGKTSGIIDTANANYSAAAKAGMIDQKQVAAELRAASANSGMNVGNTIRQRLADILIDPAKKRGFSPEALTKMEEIVRGTKTQNALRFGGNLLGGGGGLGAVTSAAVGGFATGGPGAVAPIVGYALKSLQNVLSMRQVGQLSELIRSQSPLAAQVQNPMSAWGKAAQSFGANPTPRAFAQVSLAARNLANNLKDAGITVTPADLMRSLQGPMRAPADDEQP